MQIKDQLNSLLHGQKEFVREFEHTVREFETSDIVNRNIELQKESESCRKLLEEIRTKYRETSDENERLKIALKEQILDEKLNILKISREKIETYFKDASSTYANSLLALEINAKKRMDELKNIAEKELRSEKQEVFDELKKLQEKLQKSIARKAELYKQEKQGAAEEIDNDFGRLAEKEVSEEIIQKRIRQNNIEIKIGLSWINKIGMILILIGVAYAIKYSYSNFFTATLKGIFAFAIGMVFLLVGEWFSRKEKGVFAQGLTGGGIAVLYYATFSSYFVLKIINLQSGLFLSVLITVIAMILSIWYTSRTIGSFALIGGFFPFFAYEFSFGLAGSYLYAAMGYLFLLNLLTLLLSFHKKWDTLNYISFLFNIPTLVYLVFKAPNVYFAVLYSLITFLMYLVVTISYPFKYKSRLKMPDVILLALNTSISCTITYMLFEKGKLGSFKGLLAIIFCLVYFGLGQFLSKAIKEEKHTKALFYLTSFTFAILIIPFQFGVKWLAMGWLVEGVLIIIYGYKNKYKNLEIGGWIAFALCLASFLLVDVANYAGRARMEYFDFKYLCVVLGLLGTLFIYLPDMKKDVLQKYGTRGELVTLHKYFTILNLWIYLAYTGNRLFNKFVPVDESGDFYALVLFSFITVLLAYAVSKIPLLYDRVVKGFSIFLYILADVICIGLNLFEPVYASGKNVEYFALVILLLFNVFAFVNVRELLVMLIRKVNASFDIVPLLMALYLLGNITAFFIVQFRLGKYNLVFSLVYLVMAFVFIIFGFMRKYALLRRFGLGLSVLATGKLFIYDLAYLETLYRIIAFFAFGFVMLGISFMYQKIRKSLEVGL